MGQTKKSYNLVIGVVALLVIIMVIAVVGYFVSKPKPLVIQGEAEATEYRVSVCLGSDFFAFAGLIYSVAFSPCSWYCLGEHPAADLKYLQKKEEFGKLSLSLTCWTV